MENKELSIYLSYILRHRPEEIELKMDKHGWVDTEELIHGVNSNTKYNISFEILNSIVAEDNKKRYKFNENKSRIKACQGHSIPWVEPEVELKIPPVSLYHGTTIENMNKIYQSGSIQKMKRHAVHLTDSLDSAFLSAKRWSRPYVVLVVDTKTMLHDGFQFFISDNNVWLTEEIPIKYICEIKY